MDDDHEDVAAAAIARKWLIDTGSAYDLVSTKKEWQRRNRGPKEKITEASAHADSKRGHGGQ
eukprot:6488424-Amphidinium_carterae.1